MVTAHLADPDQLEPPTIAFPAITPVSSEVDPRFFTMMIHLSPASTPIPVLEGDDVALRIPYGAFIVRHIDELEQVDQLILI